MRIKALPPTVLKLLQGKGSVQIEDGDSHRRRMQMLLPLTSQISIRRIIDLLTEE